MEFGLTCRSQVQRSSEEVPCRIPSKCLSESQGGPQQGNGTSGRPIRLATGAVLEYMAIQRIVWRCEDAAREGLPTCQVDQKDVKIMVLITNCLYEYRH